MKRIIRVRRAHPVFGRGTLEFLHPENRRVLAYLREHEGVTILCVANLSRFAQYVELDLSRFDGRVPVEMIGRVHFPPSASCLPADPRPARLLLVRADRCLTWRGSPRRTATSRPRGRHRTRVRGGLSGIVPPAVLDEWIATRRHVDAMADASSTPSRSPIAGWVAERDGAILGYATTTAATSEYLPPPDGAGELTNLYLDPAAIGTGIGRLLYEQRCATSGARLRPARGVGVSRQPEGAALLSRWACRRRPRSRLGPRRRPVPDRPLPRRPAAGRVIAG